MDSLLSRFAEDSYWLARYIERAESLARILDATKSFGATQDSGANWAQVLDLFDDRNAYRSRHGTIDTKRIIRYYVLDKSNPNSIVSSLSAAHHNARSVRHLISVEMWTHVNVFHNRIQALRARDVGERQLAGLCKMIKEDCQLFQGCTQTTLYRDQVWLFYQIGRLIESCDQTTRLVDIKTRPATGTRKGVASAAENSQWHTLLRAASAYHGYLRVHPRNISAELVAGYVLFNPSFPGSITFSVTELISMLDRLKPYTEVKQINAVRKQLRALQALTRPKGVKAVASDRHAYLQSVQMVLIELHQALATQYFPQQETQRPH